MSAKKKPSKPKRVLVERTRAGGRWTEARFWGFIRSLLRDGSRRWPPLAWDALSLDKLRVPGSKPRVYVHKCVACGRYKIRQHVQTDHIAPCGSLKSWDDLPLFASRLFCEVSGVRVLCISCHQEVTKNAEVVMNRSSAIALYALIAALAQTTKNKEKQRLLTEAATTNPEWAGIAEYIRAALDPRRMYNTSLAQFHSDVMGATAESNMLTPAEFLQGLQTRQWGRAEAAGLFKGMTYDWPDGALDALMLVIGKDLQCGLGAALWNSVVPKSLQLPEWSVALGFTLEDPGDLDEGEWWISRKYDGVRSIAVISGSGDVQFFSRSGKEQLNLANLVPHIKALGLRDTVLDGEVCVVDEAGNEDFTAIQGLMNRKNYTIEHPVFYIFDILPWSVFVSGEGEEPLSGRIDRLRQVIPEGNPCLKRVKQVRKTPQTDLAAMTKKSLSMGWEGLIFRRDAGYIGSRSKDVFKVKAVHTEEMPVVAVTDSVIQMTVDKNGLVAISRHLDPQYEPDKKDPHLRTIPVKCMGTAFVSYKGEEVGVGSGWSAWDRLVYCSAPEITSGPHAGPVNVPGGPVQLIGAELTVEFTEESHDANGKLSLRFPRVKAVHLGGRKD